MGALTVDKKDKNKNIAEEQQNCERKSQYNDIIKCIHYNTHKIQILYSIY